MADPWLTSLIAALGVTIAAAIGVLSTRGRLHRMEVVSRIINDLPAESAAREALSEVLNDDAQDLLRARRSPAAFLFALGFGSYALLLLLTTFGSVITEWSSALYLSLFIALLGGFALFIVGGAAFAIILLVRWVRSFPHKKRERASTDN